VRVLITGVGAVIGYGLVRGVHAVDRDIVIVGTDIHRNAIGRHWCNKFIQVPRTDSKTFESFLEHVLESERIDLVLPGIEQDVQKFNQIRELFAQVDSIPVLNSRNLIEITTDKLNFANEIEKIGNNVPLIPYRSAGNYTELVQSLGSPFLIKKRKSYASKGLKIVGSESYFSELGLNWSQEYIAQKIVGDENSEYSVGIFGDGQGSYFNMICLRRKLSLEGATSEAWVYESPTLEEVIIEVCRYFRPLGPTNLQFREENGLFYLLEINPRFSSSTSIRRAFNFNDAEMAIDYFFYNRTPRKVRVKAGYAQRYLEDYVRFDSPDF
jgi:carbamoyl-phosphate synthase large subunit